MTGYLSRHVDTRWLYALRLSGSALLVFYFWHAYAELKLLKKLNPKTVTFSIFIGLIVFTLWINLYQNWMVMGGGNGFIPINNDGHINVLMVVMRIMGAALVVPIIEELFWRSFIMRWIDQIHFLTLSPIMVSFKAILISSILFASEHSFWFAGLLAGFIYAYLYIQTQNLWYSIIAHGVTNLALGIWVVQTRQWQYW